MLMYVTYLYIVCHAIESFSLLKGYGKNLQWKWKNDLVDYLTVVTICIAHNLRQISHQICNKFTNFTLPLNLSDGLSLSDALMVSQLF